MVKKLRIGIAVLLLTTCAQTSGCGSAAPVARHVLTTLGTEVLVRCTFDDCQLSNSPSGELLTQTIEDYYSLINQEKYDLAWDYLSPNFKARSEERGGYAEYHSFWSSIDSVSIKEISLAEGFEEKVYVDASLKYFENDGDTFSHKLRLSFIWNQEHQRWAIDSAEFID